MSNLCTHGADVYSYDTALKTTDVFGEPILNVTQYSSTTSKHQATAFEPYNLRELRAAFIGDAEVAKFRGVYLVRNISRGASPDDLRRVVRNSIHEGNL